MKFIYDRAAVSAEHFDTDKAWQNVREKLRRGKTLPLKEGMFTGYTFFRIAAGVILLISAGIFTYRYFKSDSLRPVELVTETSTEADTLPDGSIVFLNRQTRIAYSFDGQKKTHTAKLQGEAYFTIRHDDDKPFVVETGGVFIKDIGTSFNVKAYPESHTIEVVVDEGEVIFYTSDDPGISVKAKEKGIYNKDTGKFIVAEPEPNVAAYKTKSFRFNNDSLKTVVETLNEAYNDKIQIDENLGNCRLTVSFNDENIEEIAHVIAETLGLSVSKTDNAIKLQGKGCGEVTP
jgi:ferric-dicitrate binding protein FerR (iron transport regulator)